MTNDEGDSAARDVTLALETSGQQGSVAVLRGGEVVHEVTLREDQRSAQSLTIAFRELMSAANVSGRDVSLIAVTHGPGSFTGLRVGLMAAKALAYAWKCDVVEVRSTVMVRQDWISQLLPGDVVTGSGLKPLLEKLPDDVVVAPQETWQPRAAAVGEIGWQSIRDANQPRTWQELQPHYLRGSAAEENPKFQRPV